MPEDRKSRTASQPKLRVPPRRGESVPQPVDPELTPPPMEMPEFDASSSLDEKVAALRAHQIEIDLAMGKVWVARKVIEMIPSIDEKLGTLGKYATAHETLLTQAVLPDLKSLAKATSDLAHQLPNVLHQLEVTARVVGSMDVRLQRLEVELKVSVERLSHHDHQSSSRIGNVEEHNRQLASRLYALERERDDKAAVDKALAKKQQRRTSALAGVVGAVVSGVAAAINYLT